MAELPLPRYVALFIHDPDMPYGIGSEVSGGGYARARVDYWSSPNADGQRFNRTKIAFPLATANWGELAAVGIFDAPTEGRLLSFCHLDYKYKRVLVGDVAAHFEPAALEVGGW